MKHIEKISIIQRKLDVAHRLSLSASEHYRKGNVSEARLQMLQARDNIEKALHIEELPSEE